VLSAIPPDHWPTARPFEFGGIDLLDTNLAAAVRSIEEAARAGRSQGLHLCNAYTLTLAAKSGDYRTMLGHEDAINLPDGTPVAWYYRLANRRRAQGPVRGPSLMKTTLETTDLRHFLLGGTDEVLVDLERVITIRYPGAQVAGSFSPPFAEPDPEAIEDFARRIKEARAEVVWVGLGTPRQDRVIAALVGRVGAVLVGVGAAFDFISGHKTEAPVALQQTGFEWAYRLGQEPRRLWRRYLIGNTIFIGAALRQLPSARRDSLAVRDRPTSLSSNSSEIPRVTVGRADVHCIDEGTAIALIVDAANGSLAPWLVITPNIQHVALLESDHELQACFRRADLVLADGWPVVQAVRLLSGRRLQRITGADLFPALCREAASLKLRIGIVGGLAGAAEDAVSVLRRRHPGLHVARTLEPPVGFENDPEQLADVLEKIRAADLDILFLALGTPKQEIFAGQRLDEMGAKVTVCVGAAIDFVAGRQRRAPVLLRRTGLEWAYRAVHEPRRLIPRYARSAPVFVRAVVRTRRQPQRADGVSGPSR
jgi:N-acetylglucosaminyldiphosphoundecaprenol N-acetyl-beta-D-mannosaminyltransferase